MELSTGEQNLLTKKHLMIWQLLRDDESWRNCRPNAWLRSRIYMDPHSNYLAPLKDVAWDDAAVIILVANYIYFITLPWRKLTLPVWPLSRSRFGPQFAIRLSLIWVRFKCTAVLRKARDKHRISTGSFPPSSFATAASYGDLATFLLTFYRQRYLRSSAATVTRLHQTTRGPRTRPLHCIE